MLSYTHAYVYMHSPSPSLHGEVVKRKVAFSPFHKSRKVFIISSGYKAWSSSDRMPHKLSNAEIEKTLIFSEYLNCDKKQHTEHFAHSEFLSYTITTFLFFPVTCLFMCFGAAEQFSPTCT